jgi:hypothetical protein
MLRILLWLLLIYMVVKIAGMFSNFKRTGRKSAEQPGKSGRTAPPFTDIQDADFEDLTPKENSPQPPKDR